MPLSLKYSCSNITKLSRFSIFNSRLLCNTLHSWTLSTAVNQSISHTRHSDATTRWLYWQYLPATRFPGPTRVLDTNGISIAAAILPGSLGDRRTDHAIRSVIIGRAHSREAKFCYCLRLQQIFIGADDSTDRINFSNQQLYSAVRLDGLQCMWRYTTI